MKILLILLGAAALLPTPVTRVNASVLAFDDLSDGTHLAPLNYAGFNWLPDYIYAESQGNFTGRGGLATFPTQSIAVYNGYGALVSTISSSTVFDFNGAYFTGWVHTDLPPATSITMNGYHSGTLVGSSTYSLSSSDFTWCAAQFANIDQLDLVSSASSNWWLMDNFTYNEPMPEPSTWSMLAVGFGALVLYGRRR